MEWVPFFAHVNFLALSNQIQIERLKTFVILSVG